MSLGACRGEMEAAAVSPFDNGAQLNADVALSFNQ
jgi:hypothetical protein